MAGLVRRYFFSSGSSLRAASAFFRTLGLIFKVKFELLDKWSGAPADLVRLVKSMTLGRACGIGNAPLNPAL